MTSHVATDRLASRPSARTLLGFALAVFGFAGTLVMLWHGGVFPVRSGGETLDAVSVVLAVVSTIPLVVWYRFRFGVFAVTAAAGTLLAGLGYPADLLIGATAALYLVAAHRREPWPRLATGLVVGGFALYLLAATAAKGGFPTSELLHTGLAWAAAWFAGERTRLLRQHIDDLRQRALRAERDSERERLLAIAQERARIARDLHDSAGHTISLIAVRAGAARLRDEHERYRETMAAVETLARRTAAEIDVFVSTLREDQGVEIPAGLDSLDSLVAGHVEAGLRISVETSGEPKPLGTVADQAAFRILQEALTNAARHGTGTGTVEIALNWDGDGLELTVGNPVRHDATARSGGGHGIIGMRERTNLIGGSFASTITGERFRIRVAIPYGGRR